MLTIRPIDHIITLHGWMRIIPPSICEKYEIYNGHPGLITKYPILKGKDPQKRAYEGNYKTAGCVIHKVIPEVDAGEVIRHKEVGMFNSETLDHFIKRLHGISIDLWVEFLNMRIIEDKFKEKTKIQIIINIKRFKLRLHAFRLNLLSNFYNNFPLEEGGQMGKLHLSYI